MSAAIYVLTLQASNSERDSVHSLRAVLKFAARRGLRAINARELQINPKHLHVAGAQRAGVVQAQVAPPGHGKEIKNMDMRKYRKARFLKVEDCRQPRQMRIAGVTVGKYDKPDVTFENGDRLGLSATNVDALTDAYGWESDGWIGHVVELYVDKGTFEGEPVDMVLVRPISKQEGEEIAKEPAKKTPNKPPQLKPTTDDFDDSIPY